MGTLNCEYVTNTPHSCTSMTSFVTTSESVRKAETHACMAAAQPVESVESAAAVDLAAQTRPKICFWCNAPFPKRPAKFCAACAQINRCVVYCGRSCQKKHWQAIHKFHCFAGGATPTPHCLPRQLFTPLGILVAESGTDGV